MIISAAQESGRGQRVFIEDLKGNAFRVYPTQNLSLLPCGRVRVGGHTPYCHADIRVAYAIMFKDAHESVKGLTVTVIKFHDFKIVNGEAVAQMSAETVTI